MDEEWNSDNAYQKIVSEERLFGNVYFGWSCTPYQKRKLTHIWRGVLFVKWEYCPTLTDFEKKSIKEFLEIKQVRER